MWEGSCWSFWGLMGMEWGRFRVTSGRKLESRGRVWLRGGTSLPGIKG